MLTVVIVVYKDDDNLSSCLDSVSSEIKRSEINFLIKDGESRLVPEFVSHKLSEYNHLKYISKQDAGIYDGMNQALDYVDTPFVLFLGADDELILTVESYNRIKRECFDRGGIGIIYGDVVLKKDGRLYDGEFTRLKLIKRNLCHQAVIYRAEFLEKIRFDTKYKSLADYEVNVKLFSQYGSVYCSEIISIYENRSGFSNHYIDHDFERDFFMIINKNFGIQYAVLSYFVISLRRFKRFFFMCR